MKTRAAVARAPGKILSLETVENAVQKLMGSQILLVAGNNPER
jgi:hypothetical protein